MLYHKNSFEFTSALNIVALIHRLNFINNVRLCKVLNDERRNIFIIFPQKMLEGFGRMPGESKNGGGMRDKNTSAGTGFAHCDKRDVGYFLNLRRDGG